MHPLVHVIIYYCCPSVVVVVVVGAAVVVLVVVTHVLSALTEPRDASSTVSNAVAKAPPAAQAMITRLSSGR